MAPRNPNTPRPPVMRRRCGWPGCARQSDLSVEYEPGGPAPGWLASARGIVALCSAHAAELPAALGSGRVIGVTRS
jgi:hypothetical protein